MSNDKPVILGPSAYINLPRFGIKKIPAKVDTGADSSSIWASNVNEKNGNLSFSLFGPASPFFTGDEIQTRDFEISSVKNSFGHMETRYKVKLLVEIEGRIIKAKFTLANRSENNFPVLIGRRTLHGRFIVDVSRAPANKFEVLVLKPNRMKPGGKIDSFFKEIEKDKHVRFTVASYKELEFDISRKRTSVTINSGREVSSFDLVYFFIVASEKDSASALAQYLKSQGIPYIDRAASEYYQSLNKLHQSIILQSAGVRVPRTVYLHATRLPESYDYLSKTLGSPFILKDTQGRKGRDNYLIKSEQDFKKALDQSEDLKLVAQKYIPNRGDYRMLVFGKKIRLIISRKAKDGSHLNNVSAGSGAKLVRDGGVPASAKRMAIKAATAMSIDIAGVDMICDKDKKLWYCLEVNESPQLVDSSFVLDKQKAFSDYIQRKLQKMI